jgi:hypothetical protein
VDELAVVHGEAEEPPHSQGPTWSRPIMDGLRLGQIHGHTCRGYDIAEVGDGGSGKGTPVALDEELVVA